MTALRPTALGVKALCFFALLAFAFLATTYANLLFLLMLFLAALGTLNVLWTLRNVAGIEAAVEEPEPMPAGAGGPIAARVAAGRRARLGLRVVLDLEGAPPVTLAAPLLRGDARMVGAAPPLPRGLYRVRRARLVSDWPLGLLAAVKPVAAPEALVVYPAPSVPAAAGAGGDGAGVAPRAGGLVQPSALREFRPTDETRSIHWRASARRGTLVVKEWEGGSGEGVEVVLDRRAAPAEFEAALSALSAMALAARDAKECLTLHTQGLSATFGRERRPWRELLAFLAGAEALPLADAPPPPAPSDVPRLPAATGGRR